jgi:hypothetical protein
MPHIPRIICGCGHEMKAEENGVALDVHTNQGTPYYLIKADRLRCVGCQHTIYLLAQQEYAVHHDPDYLQHSVRDNARMVTLA